jgi:hypothetical protein
MSESRSDQLRCAEPSTAVHQRSTATAATDYMTVSRSEAPCGDHNAAWRPMSVELRSRRWPSPNHARSSGEVRGAPGSHSGRTRERPSPKRPGQGRPFSLLTAEAVGFEPTVTSLPRQFSRSLAIWVPVATNQVTPLPWTELQAPPTYVLRTKHARSRDHLAGPGATPGEGTKGR